MPGKFRLKISEDVYSIRNIYKEFIISSQDSPALDDLKKRIRSIMELSYSPCFLCSKIKSDKSNDLSQNESRELYSICSEIKDLLISSKNKLAIFCFFIHGSLIDFIEYNFIM